MKLIRKLVEIYKDYLYRLDTRGTLYFIHATNPDTLDHLSTTVALLGPTLRKVRNTDDFEQVSKAVMENMNWEKIKVINFTFLGKTYATKDATIHYFN